MNHPRLFTLDEAERTLPLVRRIVADVAEEYALWREALGQYEVSAAGVRAEWGEPPELVRQREDVAERGDRISGFMGELETVGCLFKGLDSGVVDFYALREDRLIFLCWHLGEDRITHWHEVDAGFAGRQPLEETFATRTVGGS